MYSRVGYTDKDGNKCWRSHMKTVLLSNEIIKLVHTIRVLLKIHHHVQHMLISLIIAF